MAEQLLSYIAPGAPATRQPAGGDEPFLRPEIGFTPRWYAKALGVDFGERWHTCPEHRRAALHKMRAELERRFPGAKIGVPRSPFGQEDLLTGVFGACTVAGIYGLPILYRADQWPAAASAPLTDAQADALAPPDLSSNPFFHSLLLQADEIEAQTGCVTGYINWQGILNNAHRLRGEDLFTDMIVAPERCHRLFDCVCTTMIEGARVLHARQRCSGIEVSFFTLSNCLVNLVSPELYENLLLPYDRRLGEAFALLGVHNCAWTVDPYLPPYATLPRVAYLDMGLDSDFMRARKLFPEARRAVMLRPADLMEKPEPVLRADLERICLQLGPCDVVAADIDWECADERVTRLINLCHQLSLSYRPSR